MEYSANEKSDRIFKSAKLILNQNIIIMATALKFTIATKKLLQQVVKNTLDGTLEEYYNIKNQDLFKKNFLKVNTLLLELDEFAVNIAGEKVDQKIYNEMTSTVDAFEKIVQAVSL